MQNQESHFRKPWPQGVIDDGTGDEDVLFLPPLPKKPKVNITYPFELDEDVILTNKSLTKAEKLVGHQLSKEAIKNGAMDLIFEYDNQRTVFERDTPYGNNWWKPWMETEKKQQALAEMKSDSSNQLDVASQQAAEQQQMEVSKK